MEVVSQECLAEIQENLGTSIDILELNKTEVYRFGGKKVCWAIGVSWKFKSKEYKESPLINEFYNIA